MKKGETDSSTHGEVVGSKELALPRGDNLTRMVRRGTTESFHMNGARKAGATGLRRKRI